MRVLRRASSPVVFPGALARVEWLTSPPKKTIFEGHSNENTSALMLKSLREDANSTKPQSRFRRGRVKKAFLWTPRG
jgi:hypothetical protein